MLWFITLICNKLLSNNCRPHISAHTEKTGKVIADKGHGSYLTRKFTPGKIWKWAAAGNVGQGFPDNDRVDQNLCSNGAEPNPTFHHLIFFSAPMLVNNSENQWTNIDYWRLVWRECSTFPLHNNLPPERMRKMQALDHCRAFLGETTGWRRLATWLPWHWVGDCSELNLSYGGSV